eukprot:405471-Amphidinium_carterae.2
MELLSQQLRQTVRKISAISDCASSTICSLLPGWDRKEPCSCQAVGCEDLGFSQQSSMRAQGVPCFKTITHTSNACTDNLLYHHQSTD